MVGAPLAAGVLQLNGSGGLAGWQWLFLVEGLPTAVLGLLLPVLLPPAPATARWLSAEQAETVQREVDACRGADALSAPGGVWPLLRSAFTSRNMAVLGMVKFAKDFATCVPFEPSACCTDRTHNVCAVRVRFARVILIADAMCRYGVMFWAPSLIRNLLHLHKTGEDSCKAWQRQDTGARATGYLEVLLTGIPYSIAAVMNLVFAWNAQVRPRGRRHLSCWMRPCRNCRVGQTRQCTEQALNPRRRACSAPATGGGTWRARTAPRAWCARCCRC